MPYKFTDPDTGEIVYSDDEDRYDGWDAEETDRLPGMWESWENGGWVVDQRLTTQLHEKIDREAGEFRKLFITEVPGQAMTYLRKEQQARAYMVDPEGSYPLLAAEAEALDKTVEDVALSVVGMSDQWALIGDAIEARRLRAKKEVTAGPTAAAKQQAAAVDWHALLPGTE
jgi:hypothetical protein